MLCPINVGLSSSGRIEIISLIDSISFKLWYKGQRFLDPMASPYPIKKG